MKKPVKLKLRRVVGVKPTKPFAFDPTFHKPDHFTSGDNYWEPGVRWQTWNWRGKPPGIKFSESTQTTGTGASGEMRLTLPQINSSRIRSPITRTLALPKPEIISLRRENVKDFIKIL